MKNTLILILCAITCILLPWCKHDNPNKATEAVSAKTTADESEQAYSARRNVDPVLKKRDSIPDHFTFIPHEIQIGFPKEFFTDTFWLSQNPKYSKSFHTYAINVYLIDSAGNRYGLKIDNTSSIGRDRIPDKEMERIIKGSKRFVKRLSVLRPKRIIAGRNGERFYVCERRYNKKTKKVEEVILWGQLEFSKNGIIYNQQRPE